MKKNSYAQKEPLKDNLDYVKKVKKKKAELYCQASIDKYSAMDKTALVKKAILADYIVQALRYVLDLLRPFSWLFSANRKLKQVFDMISELVRMRG